MPSSSRARYGGRRPQVVGVGDLADAAADELVDRDGQHVGQRAVGVEDRRVVEAHERHAGRRRVERLLEAPPGLLEGAHALLALGDVAQPDDDAGVGLAGPVDGRLDERRRRAVGVRQPERRPARPAGRRARWPARRRGRCPGPARRARRTAGRRASVDRRARSARPPWRWRRARRRRRRARATASGRSSSSRRSSDSVSMSRSIVRLRWRVMRRDSSHVTTTAATARNGRDDGRGDRARSSGRRRGAARATTSATSSAAATTTDSTHRHIAARRRIDIPSVTSSRTLDVTAPRVCAAGPPAPTARVASNRLGSGRRHSDGAVLPPGVEALASPHRGRSGPRRGGSRAGRPAPRRRAGPGAMPRCSITCRPSSSGRIAASSSCSASSAMRASSSSIRCDSRAALRSSRVVQSQRVSTLSSCEQVAGVAHVAAHGGVAPAHLVGVEPQVQEHQLGHRGDVGGRVAQRLHPPPRHARPDDVVVVERRALAGLVATRARLADVVEQRGQAGEAEVEVAAGQLRRRRSRRRRSCG